MSFVQLILTIARNPHMLFFPPGISYADPNSSFATNQKSKCVETFCNAAKTSWSGIDLSVDCNPGSSVAKYAHPLWICSCLVDDSVKAFTAIKPYLGKEEPMIADCTYSLPPIIMCPEGLLWVQDLGHGLIALYVLSYLICIGGLSLLAYRLLRYEFNHPL